MSKNRKIALFCSCAGFGTYTPALLLKNELTVMGCECWIFVFENYLSGKTESDFVEYRKRFHRNFRFAVMASNLADVSAPQETNANLLGKDIIGLNFDSYIVLYGEWINALKTIGIPGEKILCVRLDAINTPSWNKTGNSEALYDTIWLVGKDGNKPKYKLHMEMTEFCRKSLILHGGGWGINNYLAAADSIENRYELHIIYSDKSECRGEHVEYYLPINWIPSYTHEDFPPLFNACSDTSVDFGNLCKNGCAIVSKPGGGSCIDALRYALPLVMLEPMAKHELKNAELFEHLGFGINFKNWIENNYQYSILNDIHSKIIAEMSDVPLLSEYICKGRCKL